jgi:hypothetical protein
VKRGESTSMGPRPDMPPPPPKTAVAAPPSASPADRSQLRPPLPRAPAVPKVSFKPDSQLTHKGSAYPAASVQSDASTGKKFEVLLNYFGSHCGSQSFVSVW